MIHDVATVWLAHWAFDSGMDKCDLSYIQTVKTSRITWGRSWIWRRAGSRRFLLTVGPWFWRWARHQDDGTTIRAARTDFRSALISPIAQGRAISDGGAPVTLDFQTFGREFQRSRESRIGPKNCTRNDAAAAAALGRRRLDRAIVRPPQRDFVMRAVAPGDHHHLRLRSWPCWSDIWRCWLDRWSCWSDRWWCCLDVDVGDGWKWLSFYFHSSGSVHFILSKKDAFIIVFVSKCKQTFVYL